jgi:hypothetical protein
MPRGASRFDTAEAGSPSTWEFILRAEKLRAAPDAAPDSAACSLDSADGSATVNVAKLDRMMRAAKKARAAGCSVCPVAMMCRNSCKSASCWSADAAARRTATARSATPIGRR